MSWTGVSRRPTPAPAEVRPARPPRARWAERPCPGDCPRDRAVSGAVGVTSWRACDNRAAVSEPSGTMLVMLQSPAPGGAPERLTVGVAARLSRYLQVLTQAKKMGKERISSQEIADYTNINATQIRRDLSNFGKFGKRGVGYSIDSLLSEIRKILRTQGQHNIALVGAGRLGQAIASSQIFAEHGINIAAVFDSDESKVGHELGGAAIEDERRLKDVVRDKNIVVGVLAVPAGAAQKVADDLVDSGVRIIFNYSEALLDVPGDVTVHTSNPAVELLHALYFHLT